MCKYKVEKEFKMQVSLRTATSFGNAAKYAAMEAKVVERLAATADATAAARAKMAQLSARRTASAIKAARTRAVNKAAVAAEAGAPRPKPHRRRSGVDSPQRDSSGKYNRRITYGMQIEDLRGGIFRIDGNASLSEAIGRGNGDEFSVSRDLGIG